ncbi:MAG: glycoside hydrolase family 3 C-terminal domain-containing protein [Acidimicrobiia bacterium]
MTTPINEHPWFDTTLPRHTRVAALVEAMTIDEKASQMLHQASAIEHLGVPEYNWWNECLHGVARAGKATVFPQAIAWGATFDRGIVSRMADAIALEARAKYHAAVAADNRTQYRGLTFWTPNVNLFRDPRWGRGHETYGEDPYLTGEIGKAFVDSLQGDGEYLKAAACAKHFAVHSGPEALRHEFDAVVSPSDLHETYLPAFKKLVESEVEAVMGAYNRTNGEPCCASDLLMGILRDEWGFEGHFVSDCWAISDFHLHHEVTDGPFESAALAIEKGCDLNCGNTYESIMGAFHEGLIDEAWIDRSVTRLMETRFKLGLFDPDERVPLADTPPSVINQDSHRDLAREVAEKSIVLLKNDGVLPIDPTINRILLTGPNAASLEALMANYYGTSGKMVTVLEGLVDRLPEGVSVEFKPGIPIDRPSPNPRDWVAFDAVNHDLVIAVVGLSPFIEGEEGDAILSEHLGDRETVELPQHQRDWLLKVMDADTPVVVVILGGSAVACPEVYERAAAVVFGWYPGEEGGTAIARVMLGDVAPSGRLPFTIPVSTEQLPPFDDYGMTGRTYRFMEEPPEFHFGRGLSYTTFSYSSLVCTHGSVEDRVSVSVDVTNSGDTASDEVVQVYVSDVEASVPVPSLHLEGFDRVHLAPGERKTVTFDLEPGQLACYRDDGTPVVEPGAFVVFVGGGHPDDPDLPSVSATIELAH